MAITIFRILVLFPFISQLNLTPIHYESRLRILSCKQSSAEEWRSKDCF